MIEVYDKSLKKIGVLENAFNDKTDERLNAVSFLNFTLPFKDSKNKLCSPFSFVKYYGAFYRIMPRSINKSASAVIEYTCEHSIATLMDKVLFGNHTIGNIGVYTADVIRYVLSRQSLWTLGKCDFNRQFEYHWEQENLLSALMSITRPFTNDFMWQFGTEENPFQINLIKLSDEIKAVYMPRKNIIENHSENEPTEICTRLYPLGAGEGINQITIKKINNGLPYIQSPPEIIEKYGIIERVWTDRRYESAETILEAAKKMLKELQEPRISYEISVLDLRQEVRIGDKVRIIDKEMKLDAVTVVKRMTRGSRNKAISLEVSNKQGNIASTIAELADRQRIESTYSQGATQIYAQSIQANASPQDGAELNFYIPQEMIHINKVLVKIKTEQFRSYSRATQGGGAVFSSTASGGGVYKSTSATVGVVSQTDGGGGIVNDHVGSGINVQWVDAVTEAAGADSHTHTFKRVGAHSHEFSIPDHRHTISAQPHEHKIDIPDHEHDFEIPNHSHEIEPGIFRFGGVSNFSLVINGVEKERYAGDSEEINITEMLLNAQGRIDRDKWHSIKVVPATLGYISIDVYIQGFIQSRGEVTV